MIVARRGPKCNVPPMKKAAPMSFLDFGDERIWMVGIRRAAAKRTQNISVTSDRLDLLLGLIPGASLVVPLELCG